MQRIASLIDHLVAAVIAEEENSSFRIFKSSRVAAEDTDQSSVIESGSVVVRSQRNKRPQPPVGVRRSLPKLE